MRLLDKCSLLEKKKVLSYHGRADRKRSLIGIRLIDWVLKQFGQNEFQLKKTASGRPFIEESITWEGDFNLSHSGDWVIIGITDRGYIGVDIEQILPIDYELVLQCLSPSERDSLSKIKNWQPLFYRIWTMKEAIYKSGRFQQTPLETIDIYSGEYDHNHMSIYSPDDRHIIAVYTDCLHAPAKIEEIELSSLL
ncbi:4'-phosphopantetheinyl transferase family protein [Bacillus sp. 1P06AnD]|uniref:4'-phosphopantetheinyl transferase family protein n=1 Tax=Bacillus sp. 1P06AnD TaxID=3132208 RepID=UPI0039A313AD